MKAFLLGILFAVLLAPTVYASDVFMMSSEYVIYIPDESDPAIFMTTARLNLRPEPTTSSERIALLPAGRRVEVLDFNDGEWYKVDYNGTVGFMYAAHLREVSDGALAHGTVELLHWSEAREVLTRGTIFTLVDVRTGLSWQAASFSNGNHADIEPITAEDTATKRQAFGSWTWTPRPVLVLINGRTLAASVNGMPHAGSTRSGNNMNGHVCLHFLGSTTHRPAAQHVRDHQNAVREAYNTARSWETPQGGETNDEHSV
ncbi:MAG: SH3 domain-containing protein [Defluviitaleaceae bacterium]|nr:SH3 domain-containing protein [Defluviitaleaceae bacterium]